jgi:hypothetical protein
VQAVSTSTGRTAPRLIQHKAEVSTLIIIMDAMGVPAGLCMLAWCSPNALLSCALLLCSEQ